MKNNLYKIVYTTLDESTLNYIYVVAVSIEGALRKIEGAISSRVIVKQLQLIAGAEHSAVKLVV